MEGASRAAARRADENTILAYQALNFYGLAQKGKLKRLTEYLIEKPKPRKPQSAAQMLAILQGMKGAGTPMNIRRVN
jgi:hypothetical protein